MSEQKIELYILRGLLKVTDFTNKFVDKLQGKFFSQEIAPSVVVIKKYFLKYNKLPLVEQICDTFLPKICKDESLLETAEEKIQEALSLPFSQDNLEKHLDWLIDETKEFIKRKNIEIALMECVELIEMQKSDEAISKILKASNISFDDDLGIDYYGDLKKRVDQLTQPNHVISSGIPILDDHIGGGWRNRSLVIFGAGTNVGKTLVLGAIATNLIRNGKNGVYITLEINEYSLANRIDANISNIDLNDLNLCADELKDILIEKYKESEEQGNPYGTLIIKEYPPATISAQTILGYIRELEMKRGGFKPDFICVDYLGLMVPSGKSFSDNTYGKLKTVSEELRSIASKLDIPIFSAVQVNREGFGNKVVGLENTSDSMGIPQTADVMIMMTRTEEMNQTNKMYWNVAKSRYSQNGKGFFVHVDYNHMRIYDEDSEAKFDMAKRACQSLITKKKNTINIEGLEDEDTNKEINI